MSERSRVTYKTWFIAAEVGMSALGICGRETEKTYKTRFIAIELGMSASGIWVKAEYYGGCVSLLPPPSPLSPFAAKNRYREESSEVSAEGNSIGP